MIRFDGEYDEGWGEKDGYLCLISRKKRKPQNTKKAEKQTNRVMKQITIEVSKEQYECIQDRFAIDFGWEWNDNKDFNEQFNKWVVAQALDLDLEDLED